MPLFLTRNMVRRGRPPFIKLNRGKLYRRRKARKSRGYNVSKSRLGSFRGLVPYRKALTLPFCLDMKGATPDGGTAPFREDYRASGILDVRVVDGNTEFNTPKGIQLLFYQYQHWVVVGSKIWITYKLKSDEDKDAVVGIRLNSINDRQTGDPDNNTANALADFKTSGRAKTTILSQHRRQATLTATYSARKEFHQPPLSNENIKGNCAVNSTGIPSEHQFYQIFAIGTDPDESPKLEYFVRISYKVVFFEPKTLVWATLPAPPTTNDEID